VVIFDNCSGEARGYSDEPLHDRHVSSLWVICPTVWGKTPCVSD